jgi:hypothetical protein
LVPISSASRFISILFGYLRMAYNSGSSNPVGAKTGSGPYGPRDEDKQVPPVNDETLNSIEKKEDQATDKGESKREGVVGIVILIF